MELGSSETASHLKDILVKYGTAYSPSRKVLKAITSVRGLMKGRLGDLMNWLAGGTIMKLEENLVKPFCL